MEHERDSAERQGASPAREPHTADAGTTPEAVEVVAVEPDPAPATPTEVDLAEAIAERPIEAATPLGWYGLAGSAAAGYVMGIAEVLPGFSGGTVAFVAGIYERLIANIRQGARVLSLLVRGRVPSAVAGLRALEWPFLLALFLPMFVAIFTTASWLRATVEERPVEVSAVLLGLALGATVVAARQLREPAAWHWLVTLAAAAGFFWLLGYSPGTIEDPSLLLLAAGGAIAVCAWVLPGVSGSFLLLILGLWIPVLDVIADRDLLALLVLLIGITVGLAAFSTLLNWLLARAHDVVLAIMLGLLLGSARILWPWPSEAGVGGSAELGAPVGSEAFLAAALGLTAFGLVWMFGLVATAVERRRRAWLDARATPTDAPGAAERE